MPLTSGLPLIWYGVKDSPLFLFLQIPLEHSLSNLVLASTQTQTALTVKVEGVCTDAIHNLHSNNIGNEGGLLWQCRFIHLEGIHFISAHLLSSLSCDEILQQVFSIQNCFH